MNTEFAIRNGHLPYPWGRPLEEGKGGELDAREWVRWSQMSRGGGRGQRFVFTD